MLNFAQTLSLFLQSNYDRSQSSYLLIIIVDFHNQKASILPGNNQRKYITTRTNREQFFFFTKYALREKCLNTEIFWSVFSCIWTKKKLRIWTLFTQWWTEIELLYFMNILSVSSSLCHSVTLHEKCPNTEFFLLRILLYSVQI